MAIDSLNLNLTVYKYNRLLQRLLHGKKVKLLFLINHPTNQF